MVNGSLTQATLTYAMHKILQHAQMALSAAQDLNNFIQMEHNTISQIATFGLIQMLKISTTASQTLITSVAPSWPFSSWQQWMGGPKSWTCTRSFTRQLSCTFSSYLVFGFAHFSSLIWPLLPCWWNMMRLIKNKMRTTLINSNKS